MRAFGRFIGSFLVLVAIGYVAVVLLLPPVPPTDPDGVTTGRSAAVQLAREASALMGR